MAIKKIYDLSVDLKRTSVRVNIPVLVQGDSAEFRIRLLDNGAELSTEQLTGITKVSMQSGYDAQTVIQTVGTLQGSVAVFRLQKGELFRSGTVQAMVQLEDSADRISTLHFQYQVIPDLSGNYIPGEQDITVFQRYMNEAQAKIDEMAATDVSQLTVKLADTATKEEVANALSGSPIGTYATLSLLQSDLPDGAEGVFLVQDTGHIYSWDGASWVDRGLYQSQGVADNSITPNHVAFIKKSTNILNPSLLKNLTSINFTTGQFQSSNAYNSYDFIAVKPNQDLSFKGLSSVAWYTKDKGYIVRTDIGAAGATLKAPNNAYFIRVHYHISETSAYLKQVNFGTSVLPFEEFYQRLEETEVDIEKVKGKFANERLELLVPSTNLFDESLILLNTGLTGSTGVLTLENPNYDVMDFKKIKSNTKYSFAGTNLLVYYDKDKNRIRHEEFAYDSPIWQGLTSPSNAAFVRMRWQHGYRGMQQINESATLLEYEAPHAKISTKLNLKKQPNIVEIEGRIEELESGNTSAGRELIVDFDNSIEGVFDSNEIYEGYDATFRNITSAEVYAMYDEFITDYPQYVSHLPGVTDPWGNRVQAFRFNPIRPQAGKQYRLPVALLTLGVHGYEHMPPLVMYNLLKHMCEKWQTYPHLEVLRHNVEFIIIPVVNPSGWDAYTRKNGNGVDINRNMPYMHVANGDPESITYGGASALSEVEAQYIYDIMQNEPNIDVMIDYHNFAEVEPADQFLWLPSSSEAPVHIQDIAQKLIGQMTRKWSKDFSFVSADAFVGYSSSTVPGGHIGAQGVEMGIPIATTFESRDRWVNDGAVPYSHNATKAGVEAITNYLLFCLRYLVYNR